MPTARRTRRIAAPPEQLWAVVSDPHHLPRWWPRVERVEDVRDGAFTEVMRTKKGKTVRADFEIRRLAPDSMTVCWEQEVQGTPFQTVLAASETEVSLAGAGGPGAATEVTIEMRQEMSSARPFAFVGAGRLLNNRPSWGGRLVRKAAEATIEEALTGLERISV